MLKQHIGWVLLFLVCMPELARAEIIEANWKPARVAQGVKVFTGKIEGSAFLAFKATTTIAAPLETVLETILDHSEYPDWYDNCKAIQLLSVPSAEQAVVRMEVKTPFPLANRDLINLIKVTRTERQVVVTMKSLPAFAPPVKGLVRMEKADGAWLLEKVRSGTRIVQTYHADAKAKAPAWMVNRFIVDGPINSLSTLRRRLESN